MASPAYRPQSDDDPRIPPVVGGIEANWCNNPVCENFRIPASLDRKDPCYTISGIRNGDTALKCKACGKFSIIKSNLAIAEELHRISESVYNRVKENKRRKYAKRQHCTNAKCPSYGLSVAEYPNLYKKNGKTKAGSQRYLCKACRKSITPSPVEKRHNSDHSKYLNQEVFRLYMNKVPLNRMAEITSLSKTALLNKLDMFYERLAEFTYEREQKLPDMAIDRLYLSTDRQDYNINWTQRQDRRHTTITAIGTADNVSRYVFGMNINYDHEPSLEEISKETSELSDMNKRRYNRRYARLWTAQDYNEEVTKKQRKKKIKQMDFSSFGLQKHLIEQLTEDIQQSIQPDRHINEVNASQKLPAMGCLVHSEYTQYAHFLMLSRLLRNVGKVRFYLDFETGIQRAFNLGFGERIKEHNADAFIVMADKDLTIDQKKQLTAQSKKLIALTMESMGLTETQAINWLICRSMENPIRINNNPYNWFAHPVNTRQENNKLVAYLSDIGQYEKEHKANLMNLATLTGIDVFFMLVRRRISFLERPIHTASNAGAVWHGYSPYNPQRVEKILQVFRTYYNYMLKGKDGKTPAERLGLSKGVIEARKIFY